MVASTGKADFDVLIVGAGLSGIGAAAHLKMQSPNKSFALIEQRADMGGTWDLFRYPGIRSDSDMHTLGYRFKPWTEAKAIADGASIHRYVHETAEEYDLREHIYFGHRVISAHWSTNKACWKIITARTSDNSEVVFTANFLFMCSGYYDYEQGYRPQFPDEEKFKGQIIHPQHWPNDLDYSGKKVVVIGSGATAVTIVPVMAQTAAKVTMLQRTPTYMVSQPSEDWFANGLRKILPVKMAYAITRWRNIGWQRFVYRISRKYPEMMKAKLLKAARKSLPDYPNFKRDFVPPYNPWEQRLCLVPDNDMYDAIAAGKAEIITDHIAHFDADGIALASGQHVKADIIITATGLNLVTLGKTALHVDGRAVQLADHVNYKGVMFNDIPNMVSVFGYVNASWTLKTDIVADYVCRLLKIMDIKGAKIANPHLENADMPRFPFVSDFSSGYFARAFDQLPKNGDQHPWRVLQDYKAEKRILTREPVDDAIMQFSNPAVSIADQDNDIQPMIDAAE